MSTPSHEHGIACAFGSPTCPEFSEHRIELVDQRHRRRTFWQWLRRRPKAWDQNGVYELKTFPEPEPEPAAEPESPPFGTILAFSKEVPLPPGWIEIPPGGMIVKVTDYPELAAAVLSPGSPATEIEVRGLGPGGLGLFYIVRVGLR